MTLDVTITDLFCGAGGSSLGAVRAGARLRMAANHWQRAIETHSANFPDADHDCADVSQVDPRRYPATTVLIASPECTHHSQARTKRHVADLFDPKGDASAERSRATMWDVLRFAERHRYECVVVENVIEIMRWEPIDAWFAAMGSLGYDHRVVSINAFTAHPTPQSRDRWFAVFWRRGNRPPDLDFHPLCWCEKCGEDVDGVQVFKKPERPWGKYRQQYMYRCPRCSEIALPYAWPAASAIDWSLPCPRIGDRAKPLAAATLRRIEIGLQRYGRAIVQGAGHTYERPGYYRTWPVSRPIPTQTTDVQHGLACPPFMLSQHDYQGGHERRVHSIDEPHRTVVADGNHHALVVPTHHGDEKGPAARSSAEPWPTQTGRQEHALVVPMRDGVARPPAEPLQTATTWEGGGQALVVSMQGHGQATPDNGPLMTVTASGGPGHALVQLPFVAELRGGSSDASTVADPLSTVTASGNHHGLVAPPGFVTKAYGDGRDPSMSLPFSAPFGTVTTQDHHGVVLEPFTVDYHGKGRAQPVVEPLPTQDTRDRHALVDPAIEVEDCGFRMLEPHEVGRAQAFPLDYLIVGNKRERVRLYGNAVPPPVMALIVNRCIESLS